MTFRISRKAGYAPDITRHGARAAFTAAILAATTAVVPVNAAAAMAVGPGARTALVSDGTVAASGGATFTSGGAVFASGGTVAALAAEGLAPRPPSPGGIRRADTASADAGGGAGAGGAAADGGADAGTDAGTGGGTDTGGGAGAGGGADAGAGADGANAGAEAASGAPTYRVFATREGLVGETTANGHRIRKRDHFVALPSTRSLSADGHGSRTVRVCAPATGRCEYAPVWDVGPWNIDDDYWSSAGHRERFSDVPRGTPQAQAAYQDGHNGGADGFGRQVTNPAGIDLADGTFWDGLGLDNNAWVDVTFLWLGDGPTGTIRTGTGGPLNVRSGPGTGHPVAGFAAAGAQVTIECTVWGQWVDGHLGSTPLWNRIGPGHFVSDAYTRTGTGEPVAPPC